MPKGYWVSIYRSISDQEKLAEYGKLAAPAVKAAGGRTFVRGGRVTSYESGLDERVVLIEVRQLRAGCRRAGECRVPRGAGCAR